MRSCFLVTFLFVAMAAPAAAQAPKTSFTVTHVEPGVVYVDAGKNAGLEPGMTLAIKRTRVFSSQSGNGGADVVVTVANLTVTSVSETSAACEISAKFSEIQRGDTAVLSSGQKSAAARIATATPTLPMTSAGSPGSTQPPPNVSKSLPERIADDAANARSTSPPAQGPKSLAERAAEVTGAPPRSDRPVASETSPATAPVADSPDPSMQVAGNQVAAINEETHTMPAAPAPSVSAGSAPAVSATPALTAKIDAPPISAPAAQPAPATIPSSTPSPPVKSAEDAGTASAATVGATRQKSEPASPTKPVESVSAASVPVSGATSQTVVTPVNATGQTAVAESSISAGGTGATVKTDFNVKYVAEDAVYIDGGKNAGLEEGMTLTVKHLSVSSSAPLDAVEVAEVAVVSVSNTSAVCEIKSKSADIERGDIALLSQADQNKLVQMRTLSPTRKYPQVIAFSEGDPLDEEEREAVPKPPLPEINRGRGRIGVDYTFVNSGATTSQLGGVVRVDMSRLGGSYWNLNGYWRGRFSQQSATSQAQSVFDLMNRTYTIGFTYVNPGSRWTAGVGRLFLPWATSLDTIDGAYVGRKIGNHTIVGAFAGTSPDPTSFDYNPDRRTAGTFVAFEGGSFEKMRFTSTTGVAVSSIGWAADRQFIFAENGLFYKRFISIYDSMQVDSQHLPTGGKTQGLSRSFATLRIQPFSRLSIDVNHNYFRDVPTFDPSLVGTGLLDKFLFQGLSIGSRVDLPGHISVYNNFGQSSRSGDSKSSLNQLYGLTLGRIWKTGLRADVRYSKFTSSFGEGNYRAVSLSRNFSDATRIEVNVGQQNFVSSLSTPTDYKLVGSTFDWNLGTHYFFESSLNLQRSRQQSFQQWLTTVGYRFDTGKRK